MADNSTTPDMAALVERLDKSAEYLRALPSRSSVEETAISLFGEAKDLILSQSSTIASAREVIEPFARAAEWWVAFADQQRITSLHQYGDCLEVSHLRAARDWKGR